MPDSSDDDRARDRIRAYHDRTRHFPGRFAESRGFLDWANQPDPFRRYRGAPELLLDLVPAPTIDEETAGTAGTRYEAALLSDRWSDPAAPVDRRSISQLFGDSLGLSAWKASGNARWSLRINPSSGNLHPAEGYLVAGPIAGLSTRAAVFHYRPHDHLLEERAVIGDAAWAEAARALPVGAVLVGLSSIHWREAWKYGERAYRYCQHDVGHAIAAIAVAAAGLGWHARLLDAVTDAELRVLLGLGDAGDPEAEHPDCLLLLSAGPSGATDPALPASLAHDLPVPASLGHDVALPSSLAHDLGAAAWQGEPNRLSEEHHDWPAIDEVAAAAAKRAPIVPSAPFGLANHELVDGGSALSLRRIIHQRRSAVALDGQGGLTAAAFFQILRKCLAGDGQIPFATFSGPPAVDLVLFVHRVAGLPPGLYLLVRDPAREPKLRAELDPTFSWRRPDGCPASLPLYLLEAGDARRAATQASCGQEIAGDGAFACAMLADFASSIARHGAWFYRRLHWEAGALGQLLYLEAEASGVRATGIGCFFDVLSHGILGMKGDALRVLYHFTVGVPVEDARLITLAPYGHLRR